MVENAFNATAPTRYGTFLYNRNDLYIGRSIELYGEVNELEIQLLRALCGAGSVVLDIGANIGGHTVPLAQHVGRNGAVLAFEPQRIVFQTLCANVALNSLTNVDCYWAAFGECRGTVRIPEIDYTRAANFGALEVDSLKGGRPVEQLALDDFLTLSRVDLIKIDVEGMEERVLRGGAQFFKKFRPMLYVENDRVEKSPGLIRALWGVGYRLYWHLPSFFNPQNFRGNPNNAFPHLIASNMLCFPREVAITAPGAQEIVDPEDHPTKSLPQWEGEATTPSPS